MVVKLNVGVPFNKINVLFQAVIEIIEHCVVKVIIARINFDFNIDLLRVET